MSVTDPNLSAALNEVYYSVSYSFNDPEAGFYQSSFSIAFPPSSGTPTMFDNAVNSLISGLTDAGATDVSVLKAYTDGEFGNSFTTPFSPTN